MPVNKKILSFPQIISLNLGTLGAMFAFELEIANVSGIYSFFGAKAGNLGFLWLFPLILGLIVSILVGYFSDRTYTSFGKRLPYIFAGSWLTVLLMFLLPKSNSLLMMVFMLCLYTAFVNMALQPFRPLVPDIIDEREHTKTYAIQAALIGLGAILGSFMPNILVHFSHITSQNKNILPFEITGSFYVGAIILALTSTWTVFKTKKHIPKASMSSQASVGKARDKWTSYNFLVAAINFVKEIPKVMWQVSAVQFFTWFGAFCFIIYLTPAIEQAIFHVSPTKLPISLLAQHNDIEKGVLINGIVCGIYMFASVIYAYFIAFLSKLITRKLLHILSLLVGGFGLMSFFIIHNTIGLYFAMIWFGFAWASFNSIPFAMIANTIPSNKLGSYMAIFNLAICLPQILASLSAAWILKHMLNNNYVYLMVLAGAIMVVAALLMLPIKDKHIQEIT